MRRAVATIASLLCLCALPATGAEVDALAPDAEPLASHLQLWLRAADLALSDGEAVHVWPDRSGHGRDFSATKGIRPGGVGLPATFARESRIQRRPAVRFAPESGLASSPHAALPLRGDPAFTVAMVLNVQPRDAKGAGDVVFGFGDPAPPSDPARPLAALVQLQRSEDYALRLAGGWNHDASLGAGSFRPFLDKPIVLVVTKTPGPMRTTVRVHLNGTLLGKSDSGGLEGTDALPDIRHRTDIGAFLGQALAATAGFRGDVGEVAIYDEALDDTLRQRLEAHLAGECGIILPSQIAASREEFTEEERRHWAFQPVAEVTVPAVRDEARAGTTIDRFLLERLEAAGLTFAPPADKATWLRRVTYDLTGLPPAPAEIDAFLGDDSPQALERVVARLLDSPQYGERWGRHWLDVVRYAESTANDANAVMRYAWRYRNYVIDAFNRDLPYDRFILEQLAGDLLPLAADLDARIRQTIATGFLMVGPKALAETDKEQSRLDIVDDQIDVTGRAFLGLTLGCARCHDHKFDAVRTSDYYALAGIFRSTEPFKDEVRNASMWWEFPLFQPPGEKPFVVMAPKEGPPRDLRVHLRGNRFHLGRVVPRGFLQILAPEPPAIPPEGSGRLELARWIADPGNPLTARVLVNRVWQHHFGRGIVATSDNFGTRGERPSHPELLDWLAREFVNGGWSLKKLHRLIVLSSAYRQETRISERARETDPDNRWLSSFPRRRLSAEELRDAVLAVSGELDLAPGAGESAEILWKEAEVLDDKRGFAPNRMKADHPFYSEFRKRSVYLPVVRNMLPDVLALFDAADPNNVTAARNDTTVPSQSLFMLNSAFVREQSLAFARRLLANDTLTDEERVQLAHRLAFGRSAHLSEIAAAREYIDSYLAASVAEARPESERRLSGWQSWCQTLFCSNEFLYVE